MKLADITEYEEYGNKKKNVTVSIWCLTYNHVDYIKKTFEGFLSQKTNFDIEVLVYDDASTDGTSDIVRKYAIKYPDVFHAFISKTNLYSHPDRKKALLNLRRENLTGKYLAFCEGDDYWIYDYKLQRQYDYMEMHPETSMCVHNAIRIDESKKEYIPQYLDYDTQNMNADEVFYREKGAPPTASFFLRLSCFFSIPESYILSPVGDDPLRWWCLNLGNIYYMNRCWSVRNYMHEGSWNFNIKNDDSFKEQHYIKMSLFIHLFKNEIKEEYKHYLDLLEFNCCQSYLKLNKSVPISLINTFFENKKNEINIDLLNYLRYESMRKTSEYFEWVKTQIYNTNGQLYIYGAGREAKKLNKKLEDAGIIIKGFVVSNLSDDKRRFENKPVYDIKEIEEKHDLIFWLGLNTFNRFEVYYKLMSKQTYEIY